MTANRSKCPCPARRADGRHSNGKGGKSAFRRVSEAVQSAAVSAKKEAPLSVLRGAAEPDDTDEHVQLHPADQRFSEEIENRSQAAALFTTYCIFVPNHETLRIAPAMPTTISDRLWDVSDIVVLIEPREAPPATRGLYKKR